MKRIFGAFAYGEGPRDGCWWDETCKIPSNDVLDADTSVDVVVIGGGFTGISAALTLAESGTDVAVLEHRDFGWGASGRNGGFCCLGGSKASDAELDARYGPAARLAYRQAEKDAVALVEKRILQFETDVDRHSNGETQLAHRPKDMEALRQEQAHVAENYGVEATLIEKSALAAHGMGGGPFHGALSVPLGFGLNPRKYLAGLLRAAQAVGVRLFSDSPALAIRRSGLRFLIETPKATLKADTVVIATNGYSSEDLPETLAGRYMPTQSTVLVTRPLTDAELQAQGWTTEQMCYDTRNLLHYFRLMPDRRFLFGMRGGLRSDPAAERSARRKTRNDFETMFPAWASVESPHSWSGLVCLARNKLPFVGRLDETKGIWAAMCYHGNGVAMGSYAGTVLAGQLLGSNTPVCPQIMQSDFPRFPLGRARRLLMPPLYGALALKDMG
jgi:glycine/D-amino acid oxidase-like deaminating enzyme